MQCQICKNNEATIHLTEIDQGQRTELHLCEDCASEQGIAVKSQIPLNELLTNLLSSQPETSELFDDKEQQSKCSQCGFSLEQFQKKPLLGCPNDYEIFQKSLLPLIQKAQNGNTAHCGKKPSNISVDTEKQMKLSNLRQKLEDAIRKEDYESAAKLRDEINNFE